MASARLNPVGRARTHVLSTGWRVRPATFWVTDHLPSRSADSDDHLARSDEAVASLELSQGFVDL